MQYNAVYQKTPEGAYILYGEGEKIENQLGQSAFEFKSGFAMLGREFVDLKGAVIQLIVLHPTRSDAQHYLISEIFSKT